MSALKTTTQLLLVVLSNRVSASWGTFTFISLVQWIKSENTHGHMLEQHTSLIHISNGSKIPHEMFQQTQHGHKHCRADLSALS